MGHRRKNENDGAIGCLVQFLLIIFLMPIVGLFMTSSENPDKQKLGWGLFIAGAIIWAVMAAVK